MKKPKTISRKIFRWKVKLIQNFSYKNQTEMTPLDKPFTRVVAYVKAPESINIIKEIMLKNRQIGFEIADEVEAEKLGRYRWYHKFMRRAYETL